MIKPELSTSMLPEMTPIISSGWMSCVSTVLPNYFMFDSRSSNHTFLLHDFEITKKVVGCLLYLFLYFSVLFRTTPMDSTGVPHILEHTVLCGSEKYPCRDPFFKMLNRSLSTFMNAFTGTEQ